jgi:hypothetical protein
VLLILLWWFVLGCRANWDSDDDPGKWSNHVPNNSVIITNGRTQILSAARQFRNNSVCNRY